MRLRRAFVVVRVIGRGVGRGLGARERPANPRTHSGHVNDNQQRRNHEKEPFFDWRDAMMIRFVIAILQNSVCLLRAFRLHVLWWPIETTPILGVFWHFLLVRPVSAKTATFWPRSHQTARLTAQCDGN